MAGAETEIDNEGQFGFFAPPAKSATLIAVAVFNPNHGGLCLVTPSFFCVARQRASHGNLFKNVFERSTVHRPE